MTLYAQAHQSCRHRQFDAVKRLNLWLCHSSLIICSLVAGISISVAGFKFSFGSLVSFSSLQVCLYLRISRHMSSVLPHRHFTASVICRDALKCMLWGNISEFYRPRIEVNQPSFAFLPLRGVNCIRKPLWIFISPFSLVPRARFACTAN